MYYNEFAIKLEFEKNNKSSVEYNDISNTLQIVGSFFEKRFKYNYDTNRLRLSNTIGDYSTLFNNEKYSTIEKQKMVLNFLKDIIFDKLNDDLASISKIIPENKTMCSFNTIIPTRFLLTGINHEPHHFHNFICESHEILFSEFDHNKNITRENGISHLKKFLNDYCGEEI